ncbi:putative short-chain dehydrogenases/reductase [Aspergillus carlsbadensis]|nr:putative short-chain dehydrogenases/reductase [Aspergillus carlsbadensis]
MPSIDEVQRSNAALTTSCPEIVAVFVGGTSGVGEESAKRLAKSVQRPVIFLVGRNEKSAAKIIAEMRVLNLRGTYNFIQCDVSLLRNVDVACRAIARQAPVLDLLFLSTGSILVSQEGTAESLEKNQVERYYARMRFVANLMPLLKASKSPRVVSVLLAGYEIELDENDLQYSKPCSSLHGAKHAATMTSLAMEYLAAENPSVSFVHVWPGIVKTPLLNRGLGWFFAQHSGQYHVYMATSAIYPPSTPSSPQDISVSIGGGGKSCIASTGEVGGGSYILNYKGDNVANDKLMAGYRQRGYPRRIWLHTLDIFQSVLGHSQSVPDN